MKINSKLLAFTAILVVLTTVIKFFCGPDLAWSGFSPVIAIALFSGMIIQKRDQSFLLPIAALLISDLFIHLLYLGKAFPYPGFYEGQWINYLLLFICTVAGWVLKGRTNISLLAGAIIAPTLYFLASNFTSWLGVGMPVRIYSNDFTGLMNAYEAALPFYRNSLLSTLLFFPVILFAYNYLMRKRTVLTIA